MGTSAMMGLAVRGLFALAHEYADAINQYRKNGQTILSTPQILECERPETHKDRLP